MTTKRGMTKWSVVGTAIVLGAMALGTVACGRGDGLRRLPRYVATSVQRDFPDCRGRHVRGRELGGGRYEVVDCGMNVVYACPRHAARWRGCELEQQQAQPVYAVVQQPQQQQGVVVVTAGGQATGQTATVLVPPPPQDTAGAQTPQQQATEATVRQWLDGNRGPILQCTQTQAALVEVVWTAEGVPTVALGGEMHGTPGEQCVVQALGSVQFQNTGGPGQVRHVIQ